LTGIIKDVQPDFFRLYVFVLIVISIYRREFIVGADVSGCPKLSVLE